MRRFSYSVSEADVTRFVGLNGSVSQFLNKYDKDASTYGEKAVGLCRFFEWLRVVKGVKLSPDEFLDLHLSKRSSRRVDERRWALSLALEFSRDNPDLKDHAKQYKYSAFFLPIKLFCDANETPLTSNNGFFPKRGRRKYQDKAFTSEYIRRILGFLNERDRAVCLVQLQSGQSIHQVLVDINGQADYVFREIDAGKTRIRFDFAERKGNGFQYFTFISQDAIQQLQKWRSIREAWLNGKKSRWLFITKTGKPLDCKSFHNNFRLLMKSKGLYKDPYDVRRHGFRKFFEQESSPPERGISKSYISFMMGHSRGSGEDHKLDVVGGVYDPAPKVYPDAVEKEYAKLEPYLNVYTGRPGDSRFTDVDRKVLDLLSDPEMFKELEDMLKKRKRQG